ncbi:MAG: hypothetical protein EHM70_04515 [Chloroflexota bacterium]|nr:MAG: hypothetical protein EHM70_04515 [Chloroflexota bacterium]
MNMPRFFMLLCVSVVLIITLNLIQDPSSPWTPVGTGVDYQEFVLAGPVHAYVARMDRTNPNVILESTLAQGKLGGGYETVSDMAERYDQAINFWNSPLAARNNVVIAINGSFVEPDTGAPQSGQIQSGWYVKRFNDYGGGSGFAWKMDRSAFIGECVYHRPEKQLVTVLATGETIPITGINIPRKDNQLIVYTPQYDSDTNTDTSGVEILVEMAKPSQVIPLPRSTEGVVREIRDGLGSTPIPFDSIVLSAAASTREDLLSIVHIGDRIGISQEITSMERDCNTPSVNSWTKTYTSISGSFFFLKNGEIQSYTDDKGATDRHPRTAIA